MPKRRLAILCLLLIEPLVRAAAPASQPAGHLPHITVDVIHKQVRIECSVVKADYPLEFLAVVTNTNEYESLVHTDARPSDVHVALLMLGLQPGQPIHFDPATKTWLAPTGPLIQIRIEYDDGGKHIQIPAWQWMRDVATKKPPTDFSWCFTGSRIFPNNLYAADTTGNLIGVINNELSVLDVPALKSRALESREWERNPDLMPQMNTPVTLILSPAPPPATQPTTNN